MRERHEAEDNMETLFRIDAETWYPEDVLRFMGLDGDRLMKARESGELRATDRGGIWRYKGQWILDWLEGAKEKSDAS